MKKGFKILLSVLAFVYFSIIIVITGFLLCYNQYKITVINNNTFLLIDDKSDKYSDGDLVIVKKNANSEINVNDEILFYDIEKGKVTINTGNVTATRVVNADEMTFTVDDDHDVSSQAVVGKTSTAKVYPVLGKLLYIVESRFGFLLFVIFPALLFFFYEAYRLVHEIRNSGDDAEEKSEELNSVNTVDNSVNETVDPVLETAKDDSNLEATPAPATNTLDEEVSETRNGLEEGVTSVSNNLEATPAVSEDLKSEPSVTNTIENVPSEEKNDNADLSNIFNSSMPSENDGTNSSESNDVESLF